MENFDFLNPDYNSVFEWRRDRIILMRKHPEMVDGLREFYTTHPVEFITDWGCTFDPRNAEIGLPTVIPFILFEKQKEYILWLYDRWKAREDGLSEKSRDMGVSWLCCAFGVWMWTFHKGVVVGFGSRKEEYVDKIGDPKSLFWKMREFIKLLPQEFKPKSYDDPYMRIVNNDNGSAIVGEAGDNIGRGNRTSIYFKDESAFYERPEAIDAALSQTSNCKIDVSTPNGNGNPFFRKRHGGKIPVFSFHWKDDPRKDDKWYKKQQDQLDPVILAQEVNIDYNASVANAWISGELIIDAQNTRPADIEAIGHWHIGVDAAHFGDDESVIHIRKGRFSMPQIKKRGLDGIQLAGLVEEQCRTLEQSGGKICSITIELDGPGVSCHDQLRIGKYKQCVNGIHTGARLSDDANYNIRALLWRRAKEYLEDKPVHFPTDQDLRSQLSSMLYNYKDGLLLMQKKSEYKKTFGRSPDSADAFVLTMADPKKSFSSSKSQSNYGSSNWQDF